VGFYSCDKFKFQLYAGCYSKTTDFSATTAGNRHRVKTPEFSLFAFNQQLEFKFWFFSDYFVSCFLEKQDYEK